MGGDRGEGHDARCPGRPDLRVAVREVAHQLRVFRRPGDVRHATAGAPGFDRLQRVAVEKARLDARMIGDEVQARPVARRLRQVTGVATQRVRRPGRQPFVHADIVEAGLALPDAIVVALNQLERRVRHLLVVVSPPPHQAVRIVVDLGRVRDVVALPGIRLVLVDLSLDVLEVTAPDVEQPVPQHPG